MKRRLIPALAVFQLLLISNAFPKSLAQIDFYGIASKDTEKNMLSMTEDIFFAQLKELEYTINDRRSENFSEDFFSGNADFSQSEKPDTGIFYAVISKIDAAEWKMELVLKTHGHKEPETENKIYNSYYKILMESKTSLRGIVENLAKTSGEENKTENNGAGSFSLENLAGNWSDGKFLSKIVIMRGGRGFVIFKNGASMNISVKIEQDENQAQSVKIVQTSGNNASYFPEIDRQKALELAMTAEPIRWTFKMEKTGILSGTVETLVQSESGKIARKSVFAEWTKN